MVECGRLSSSRFAYLDAKRGSSSGEGKRGAELGLVAERARPVAQPHWGARSDSDGGGREERRRGAEGSELGKGREGEDVECGVVVGDAGEGLQ